MMRKTILTTGIAGVALLAGIAAVPHHRAVAQVDRTGNTMLNQDKTVEIKEALACNLAAMTPPQRKRYEVLKKRLRSSAKEVKELPNGYALRYASEPNLLMAAAEFITLEGRCCSFYGFAVEVGASGGPLWLRITGPKEAKPFIHDALIAPNPA